MISHLPKESDGVLSAQQKSGTMKTGHERNFFASAGADSLPHRSTPNAIYKFYTAF
jgi:hypothetical protein